MIDALKYKKYKNKREQAGRRKILYFEQKMGGH